ncbi:MAG TPA: DUF4363 family protein [Clostridiales bacterium]|nr:DUF4363 family protein [Clostridiales bacterium]
MKLTIVCLILLGALIGLAIWQQNLIKDLADQTEAALSLALSLADQDQLPDAQFPLREIVKAWEEKKVYLHMLGDHARETDIRISLSKLAAYAEHNDRALFYGEAAKLSMLLDEIRELDQPILNNIL